MVVPSAERLDFLYEIQDHGLSSLSDPFRTVGNLTLKAKDGGILTMKNNLMVGTLMIGLLSLAGCARENSRNRTDGTGNQADHSGAMGGTGGTAGSGQMGTGTGTGATGTGATSGSGTGAGTGTGSGMSSGTTGGGTSASGTDRGNNPNRPNR